MINSLLTGLISFIVNCISLFTSPINSLISQYIPSFSTVLSTVNNFVSWLTKFVLYIASWVNFDGATWTFIVACASFLFLVPLLAHSIKLILRWYRMLMP